MSHNNKNSNACLTLQGLDLQWLEEKLPYIPVNLLEDVVDLTHRHGKEALGVFTNGVIELAKNTPKGVEYHEAFHAVFNSYLSKDVQESLLKETDKSEEQLADEFSDYVRFNIKPSSNNILQFFRKLRFWIKEQLGLIKIHDLYQAVEDSYFKNKKPFEFNGNPKFKEGLNWSNKRTLNLTKTLKVANSCIYSVLEDVVKDNNLYGQFFNIDPTTLNRQYLVDKINTWIDYNIENNKNDYFKSLKTESSRKEFLDILLKKFTDFNIDIQVKDENNSTVEEKDKLHIYDKKEVDSVWDDKLSSNMKIFLSTIPILDESNEYVLDEEFGLPQIYPLNHIKNSLNKDLKNIQSIDQMISILEQKSTEKPFYKSILWYINNYEDSSSSVVEDKVDNFYYEANPLRTQFFKLFQGFSQTLITTSIQRTTTTQEIAGKDVTLTETKVKTYNQNTSGVNNTVKQVLLNNVRLSLIDRAKTKNIPVEEYKKVFLSETSDLINSIDYIKNTDVTLPIINKLNKALDIFVDSEVMFKALVWETPLRSKDEYDAYLKRGLLDRLDRTNKSQKERLIAFYTSVIMGGKYNPRELNSVIKEVSKDNLDLDSIMIKDSKGNLINTKNSFNTQRSFFSKLKDKSLPDNTSSDSDKLLDSNFDKIFNKSYLFPQSVREFLLQDSTNLVLRDSFENIKSVEGVVSKDNFDYTEMSPIQFDVNNIISYFGENIASNNYSSGSISVLPEIIPSDKSNNTLITFQNNNFFKPRVMFEDLVNAEFERIVKVRRLLDQKELISNKLIELNLKESLTSQEVILKSSLQKSLENLSVKNLFSNGTVFLTFNSLNNKLDSYLEYHKADPLFKVPTEDINILIKDVLNRDTKSLIDKNILSFDNKELKFNPKLFPTSYNNLDSQDTTVKIKDYLLSSYVINLISSNIMVGDIALYKPAIGKDGSFDVSKFIKTTMSDANKRGGQTAIPYQILDQKTLLKPTFKLLISDDPKYTSENLELLKELYSAQGRDYLADKYDGIDMADAYAQCTIDRAIQILMGLGDHNNAQLQALLDIKTGNIDPESLPYLMKTATTTLKMIINGHLPMEHNIYNDNFEVVDTITIPTLVQIKYAVFPLLKEFTQKYPQLDKVRQKMEDESVDEYTFSSAFKNGAWNIQNIETVDNWLDNKGTIQTIELPQYFAGRVLEQPVKSSVTEKLSTQKQRKITENIEPETNFRLNNKNISGKDLVKKYNNTISDILNSQFKEFRDTLFTNGSIDPIKLKSFLKDQLLSKEDFISDDWQQVLDNLDKDNLYLLDLPLYRDMVYSIISTAYDKKVWDIELTGKSAVLASTYHLFDKNSIETSDSLRAATLFDNRVDKDKVLQYLDLVIRELNNYGFDYVLSDNIQDNEIIATEIANKFKDNNLPALVTPDEIIVSPKYFLNQLKKKGLDPINFVDKNGNLSIDLLKDNEELKYCSFHRIPLQGKNSVARAYIKDFSYSTQEVIFFHPDSLVRSGGDFDIDKVYLELYDFDIAEKSNKLSLKKKDNSNNTIIDIHNSIMSNPNHFIEMMLPNNVETIAAMASKQKVSDNPYWFSTSVQSRFREQNIAGKDLIGVISVASVQHSINQIIKPVLDDFDLITFNNKLLNKFGETRDIFGDYISENIQQQQNAAVDNAKDPHLGKLNWSLFTSPLKNFFTAIGLPIPVVEELTNNEVYNLFLKTYNENIITNNDRTSTNNAWLEVLINLGEIERPTKFDKDLDNKVKDKLTNTKGILDLTQFNKNNLNPLDKSNTKLYEKTATSLRANDLNMAKFLFHSIQYARQYSDFTTGFRLSNNGINSKPNLNIDSISKYNRFVTNSQDIIFDVDAYQNSMYNTYVDIYNGFEDIINNINSYHSDYTKSAITTLELFGLIKSKDDYKIAIDAFNQFILCQSEDISKLVSNQNKWDNITEIASSDLKTLKNRYKVGENLFLDSLDLFEDGYKGEGLLGIRFNKDSASSSAKSDIKQYAEILYTEEPEFTKNLFIYSLKRFGFSTTGINPMKYLPNELFEEVGVFSSWKDNINIDPISIDSKVLEFTLMFAKNNPSFVREVSNAQFERILSPDNILAYDIVKNKSSKQIGYQIADISGFITPNKNSLGLDYFRFGRDLDVFLRSKENSCNI